MTPKTAAQLLKLLELKTKVEQQRLEEVARVQRADRAAAKAMSDQALASPPLDGVTSAAHLLAQQEHMHAQFAKAEKKLAAADSLTPAVEARRDKVRDALRREQSWSQIKTDIETQIREKQAAAEENSTSELVIQRAAQNLKSHNR